MKLWSPAAGPASEIESGHGKVERPPSFLAQETTVDLALCPERGDSQKTLKNPTTKWSEHSQCSAKLNSFMYPSAIR